MPAMTPEITLIKKSGPNPIMSKRIFLDEQGKVCSDGSQCLMAQGTATRATAETAADLAKHIMACGTDQAIALGSLRADLPDPAKITTQAKLKDNPGAITRSRDFINYRPGAPAWALIDFDTKGMPANVAASIEAAGGMWNALLTVAPGLATGGARITRQHEFWLVSPGHRNAVRRQRGFSPLHSREGCERYRTLSPRSARPMLAAGVGLAPYWPRRATARPLAGGSHGGLWRAPVF